MSALNNRLKKLEAAQPKEDLRPSLTFDELQEEVFLECEVLHKNGIELDPQYALLNVRCREFFSDEHWVKNHNHRISVFLKFRQIGLSENMTERVEDIFALGWRNIKIDKKEITWIVDHLKGIDLGPETPWLKGYLGHSGES